MMKDHVDLRACVNGEARAWAHFTERFAGVIHAAVTRSFARHAGAVDRSEIEDAVQDVFVRLIRDDYRLLATYDPQRASLSTWLTVIARSAAIDHLRRRKPAATLDSVPDQPDPAASPEPPERDAPALPLHVLTGRQRLVLRLLFDDGCTVEAAAAFLGVDPQTIRSTKHKALSRLRGQLSRQ